VEVTGEVTSPEGRNQSTGLSYDHFFKEAGIRPAGEDFDAVGADFFDSMNQGCTYMNGVEVKPQEPKKDLVCHAAFKVQFIQFEDGSTWGDYQTKEDVMADGRRIWPYSAIWLTPMTQVEKLASPPLWMSPNRGPWRIA